MDAVGAVGGAGRDLVQEDDVALPFLYPHRVAGEAIELRGERGQLVIMRREQGAAAIAVVEMLDRSPGDREPVIGRGAAADLVEDDEGARPRLVEDRRGLDHLDHEGRAAAREIVGRADPAEEPIDDADLRRLRRARRSPSGRARQSSAFWRRKVLLPAMFGPVSSQSRCASSRSQSLATKLGRAARSSACSTTGWRPCVIAKAVLSSIFGRDIALGHGEIGERRGDIERGERRGATRDLARLAPALRRRDRRRASSPAPALYRRPKRSCSRARRARPSNSASMTPGSGDG